VKTHEPSGVVTFAFKLAHAISAAFQSIIVIGGFGEGKSEDVSLMVYQKIICG
jgi:hypothetical protein